MRCGKLSGWKPLESWTGGVAHDFNNLLMMIIGGSVQRLRRDLTGEMHTRLLDMIANATSRGESLTRQLLAFSRRQTLTPAVIDLTTGCPRSRRCWTIAARGCHDHGRGSRRGLCDPRRSERARACPAQSCSECPRRHATGGALSITAKPVVLKGQAVEEELSGEFVAIRVADTGSGIPADVCRMCSSRSSRPRKSARAPGWG